MVENNDVCFNCFWDDVCPLVFKNESCDDFTPLVIDAEGEKEYIEERYQFMEDWNEYEELYN